MNTITAFSILESFAKHGKEKCSVESHK